MAKSKITLKYVLGGKTHEETIEIFGSSSADMISRAKSAIAYLHKGAEKIEMVSYTLLDE